MLAILVCIFVLCLIYHTYTDLKEMLLYDWVNALIAISGLIYAYLGNNLREACFGFGVGLVIMLGIYLISKGGLGEGDVKLVPCLGLWLGFDKTLLALLLAFIFGAIIGLGFMAVRGKKLDTAIPFGPFLCLGAILSFFLGNEIINAYYSFFF